MVLERLVTVRSAIKRPFWVFIIGGLISTISLSLSFLLFPDSAGFISSFFITFGIMPFMLDFIKYEGANVDQKAEELKKMNIFQRHRNVIMVYTAFFTGMVLTQTILYIMIPESLSQKLFEDQITQINLIRGRVTFSGTFSAILFNNSGVLLLSFLFSFLFGAGAVFILAWNASVLSVAIGMTAKSLGGLKGIPLAILTFFPHGSLEILAYFIGGIAGGLASISFTKRKTEKFSFILRDSFEMILTAFVLLVIAAAIETTMIVV
ncbi:MAG: stage II sporulation protein M [Candidatus Aenigmatarchaeota archaeon]